MFCDDNSLRYNLLVFDPYKNKEPECHYLLFKGLNKTMIPFNV